jgi:predicted nucleic-acid-binding protein
MRLLVDTNAILRFLLKDNALQCNKVHKLFDKSKDSRVKLLVPEIVVFEVVFTLQKYYDVPKIKLIEQIRFIVSASYLEVESRDLFLEALKLYEESNLSLVDCFLVAKAKGQGVDLFTFDKKLTKLLGVVTK